MLNKQKGDMYGFVTHTWNTISGKCNHNCIYCYNKDRPYFQGQLRFMEKNLKDDLGEGNFIFVGSSNDLFQKDVPKEWILKTLEKCRAHRNIYLFQTKNPARFEEFMGLYPRQSFFGTTIETNRNTKVSDAPIPAERILSIYNTSNHNVATTITIEPILDFDLDVMLSWIEQLSPDWVSIGADSKNNNLPEPSPEKIVSLIRELREITKVIIKPNLYRIIKRGIIE